MSEIFNVIDYIGTFVFAVTGASIGARFRFDLFGMLFLAFLTAVGGGTARDIIIDEPVFWTLEPIYLYTILVASFSTFFFLHFYERQNSLLLFLDTLGVGIFVVIGAHKSLIVGFNGETAFLMGTMSAVLGGILRSAFSREFSILSNKELYATVAAVASLLFVGLRTLDVGPNVCAVVTILFTFTLRYLALSFKVQLPTLEKD